jgi:hypothetical protein
MPVKPTKEEAESAGLEARAQTISLLSQREKLSLPRLLSHLERHLIAKAVKATYDKEAGEWVYSKKLDEPRIQLDALKLGLTLYDAFPSEKHDHTVDGGVDINVTRSIVMGEAK